MNDCIDAHEHSIHRTQDKHVEILKTFPYRVVASMHLVASLFNKSNLIHYTGRPSDLHVRWSQLTTLKSSTVDSVVHTKYNARKITFAHVALAIMHYDIAGVLHLIR